MAYDEGLAQILREAVAPLDRITERRMFGGLAFMWRGHMLCGVHTGGAMMRVGKEHEEAALALDGVTPLAFTGRPMGGFVDLHEDVLADEPKLAVLLGMAQDFVGGFDPK